MAERRHKDGTIITGLDDGGVAVSFPEAPSHRRNGRIEVSFSAKTIRRMKKLGQQAIKEANGG